MNDSRDRPKTGIASSRLLPFSSRLELLPWWLLVIVGAGLLFLYLVLVDTQISQTFWFISGQKPELLSAGKILFKGIVITITVTIFAYSLAVSIGVTFGLMRSSRNPVLFNVASLYVEVTRGIPMLVLLLYVAFALTPLLVSGLSMLGLPISIRNIPNEARAILALGIGYGAFSAEIFRSGIQSVGAGQKEAAQSLGLSYGQTTRFVILPQAIRNVLPALGNDFIAMIKDSSLVAVLGVQDMTQLTRLYFSGNFLYMQSLTVLAAMYLILVLLLTRGVRHMERRLRLGKT